MLGPRERMSVGVTTKLTSRYGPQTFMLVIAAQTDDGALRPITGYFDVVVDSPLSAFPPSLDVGKLEPGGRVERRIILGDTLENNPVQVDSITTSNPKALTAAVVPTNEIVTRGKGFRVRGRYALNLEIVADDRDPVRNESILIHISDGREIRVPVIWSVALDYEISPRELVFNELRTGSTTERFLFVRRPKGTSWAPALVQVPSKIKAVLEPHDSDEWRLRVTIDGTALPSREAVELVLSAGPAAERVAIPIIVRSE